MRSRRALEGRRDLAIVALIILGLGLWIIAAAIGLRVLSADWNAVCHRVLHAQVAPGFAGPWRLTTSPQRAPCLHRQT